MHYELLEHISFGIKDQIDLVNWIASCKGSANLGDLSLITYLPAIAAEYYDFNLGGSLYIDRPLKREACILIGQVSRLFSRIEFGYRCMTMLHAIEFSKNPLVCLNLLETIKVKEEHATSICEFLQVSSGRIGALMIDIEISAGGSTEDLHMLVDEIGQSELLEVNFRCFDQELYAHLLKNACRMASMKSLCFEDSYIL
jgi:hypothetical protein